MTLIDLETSLSAAVGVDETENVREYEFTFSIHASCIQTTVNLYNLPSFKYKSPPKKLMVITTAKKMVIQAALFTDLFQ